MTTGTSQKAILPKGFSDLERFVADWVRPTMAERHRRRLASTPEERKAFYDIMMPRLPAATDYLNKLPLHDMPDDAAALLQLALSLTEVSLTLEVYDANIEAVHAETSKLIRISQEMDGL